MRIAIMTFGYPDRKNSVRCIFTKEQAEALVEIGTDVTVFDLAADPWLYPEPTGEIFSGLLVHRLPKEALKFRPFRLHERRSYLRRALARDRFDSALFNFLRHEHYHYLSIVRRHCNRLAMIVHGSDVMAMWQSPAMHLVKRSLLRRMDCVFAVSDFTATLARTLLPAADAHRVVVNYNGIAQAKLVMADGVSKELARRKLGIELSTPLLLTTANLVRRKGVDIMLRVLAELRREGIPAQYIVVGAGDEKRSLEKLANDLGISDAVRFAGRLLEDRDVVELMVACDIYCMISRIGYDPPQAEGFGIANAEAQALGRPVIGGRTGGVPSAVADGLTGVLVDPEAADVVERICREVRRLLGDNDRYHAFSEAARTWARSRFDWRDHARLIVDTIDRVDSKRVTEVAC